MRALFGGAIGAAVAAAAWLAFEHFTQANMDWLVCFVGVVTGICVQRAGGVSMRGSIALGALAVGLTLAAIAGGQQVYAKIMQASAGATAAAPAPSADQIVVDAGTTDNGAAGKAAAGEAAAGDDAAADDATGEGVAGEGVTGEGVAGQEAGEGSAADTESDATSGAADGTAAPRDEKANIPTAGMDQKPAGLGQRGYSKSAMKKNFSEWDMVWMSLAALAAYVTGKGGDKAASQGHRIKP